MPQYHRKREQKAVKRRRQQKDATKARHQRQANALNTPRAILRHVRGYPVYEFLISENWHEPDNVELVQLLLARKQPDGDIAFAVYLVDPLCLGLKNTMYYTHYSPAEYENGIKSIIDEETPLEGCPVELAHQMIYGAIEYAAQFGFQPNRDLVDTQLFLEPRGTYAETYELTFGRDGKPLFIAGPYDNIPRILARLDKAVGPGNYAYVAPIEEQDLDDDLSTIEFLDEDNEADEPDDLSGLDYVDADPHAPKS